MMETLKAIDSFLTAHPYLVTLIVGYVVANVLPRIPTPATWWGKLIVDFIDRLCILAGDKWGGGLKLPGTATDPRKSTTIPPAAILCLALLIPSCAGVQSAAKTAADVLTRVEDATQYLDSAFEVFCLVRPSVCTASVRAEYSTIKGTVQQSVIVAHNTAQAISTTQESDVRKAYTALEQLLMKLGVIVPSQNVVSASSDGWKPWAMPVVF